jgi:choline-sulfatase
MLSEGGWKLIYHVGMPAQLFDLAADPGERVDLIEQGREAARAKALEAKLRTICDPEAVDARAKARQAELLARYGGREAALARGDLGFTPAPGTNPEMN